MRRLIIFLLVGLPLAGGVYFALNRPLIALGALAFIFWLAGLFSEGEDARYRNQPPFPGDVKVPNDARDRLRAASNRLGKTRDPNKIVKELNTVSREGCMSLEEARYAMDNLNPRNRQAVDFLRLAIAKNTDGGAIGEAYNEFRQRFGG